MEKEPEFWTYELLGGPHDGATGRSIIPRTTVCRPSLVDSKKLAVYHLRNTFGERRHAVYRYSHDVFAVLATIRDV